MAKRLFDLFFSFFGLLFLWPLFLIVAVIIFFDDGLPIFFRQERVGQFGKTFKIWKFRTMVTRNEGPKITVGGDRRILPVGHHLRKYKIDELPQLINVLMGEMSFVGPRPEVSRYVDIYNEEQRKVLNVKPGITDPASIKYYNESEILEQSSDPEKKYVEEIMPDKLKVNLEYLRERSLFSDIKIIFKTVFS